MLTLGFTLPAFQLFFNTQPLPQGKIMSCLPDILAFQVRQDLNRFPPHSNTRSNSVFFAGESQHGHRYLITPGQLKWLPVFFVLPSLTKSTTSHAACAWLLSVFKELEPHWYYCLLLCWQIYQMAQIPAQFFILLKIMLHVVTWSSVIFIQSTCYMGIMFHLHLVFDTLELQCTALGLRSSL